ncbi:uncharacterized protein LOC144102251 [Amblyomma americanum]
MTKQLSANGPTKLVPPEVVEIIAERERLKVLEEEQKLKASGSGIEDAMTALRPTGLEVEVRRQESRCRDHCMVGTVSLFLLAISVSLFTILLMIFSDSVKIPALAKAKARRGRK